MLVRFLSATAPPDDKMVAPKTGSSGVICAVLFLVTRAHFCLLVNIVLDVCLDWLGQLRNRFEWDADRAEHTTWVR